MCSLGRNDSSQTVSQAVQLNEQCVDRHFERRWNRCLSGDIRGPVVIVQGPSLGWLQCDFAEAPPLAFQGRSAGSRLTCRGQSHAPHTDCHWESRPGNRDVLGLLARVHSCSDILYLGLCC